MNHYFFNKGISRLVPAPSALSLGRHWPFALTAAPASPAGPPLFPAFPSEAAGSSSAGSAAGSSVSQPGSLVGHCLEKGVAPSRSLSRTLNHLKNGMIIVVTTLKIAVRVKGTNIDVGMHIQLSKMAGLFVSPSKPRTFLVFKLYI